MKHKYLEDVGVKLEHTPWGWHNEDDRQEDWKSQREIYGFDERETWDLHSTFYYWLYERLMMFDEINIIDTNFHEINVNGEILTLQECIDRMIFGCKYYFKLTVGNTVEEPIAIQIGEEILDIFKQCIFYLWW